MSANTSAPVRKAVIPAAGLGTRFLPATKSVPKEMLPVVDRPAIDYVVSEAAACGLDDVLIITARGKTAIEDYFDRSPELEAALEKKGDTAKVEAVRRPSQITKVHAVRQGEAKGLGHAVLVAAEHVGDEPFAVLLGDDLIDERDPLLQKMIDVQARYGGSVIGLQQVPGENISLYGVAAAEPVEGEDGVVRVRDLVEKPPADEAPSDLAIIGRYVLSPTVFSVLRETPPGRGGEIQLTDALKTLAQGDEPVHGVVFRGRRFDTGDKGEYLRTVVTLAAERDDLGPELIEWLRGFVAERAGDAVAERAGDAVAERAGS
jgi:UTP--glucose-1-phosphate uridylyltransferase